MELTPFAEAHLPVWEVLLGDPDVERFTLLPAPAPPDFARRWLAGYEQGRRDGTKEAFAVVTGDGEVAGAAMAFGIDTTTREGQLGYLVAPAWRGQGVATLALGLLTHWAFDGGLLRVTLRIDVHNVASQRVAGKCGYVLEGTMRSVHLKRDRRSDTQLWSKLPSDP